MLQAQKKEFSVMSEESKASGQAENTSGVDEANNQTTESVSQKEDKVAYETYKKVLAEAKAAKEKAKQLEAEVSKYSQSELEAKGKQSELIDSLRTQLSSKDKEIKEFKTNYAFKLLTAAVEAEGVKHGCRDTDLLLKSLDLNAIEFGDDFSINMDDVKREVSGVVTKKPFLFETKVKGVNDVNVKVDKNSLNGKKELNKMSLAEKIKMAAELSANGAFAKVGTKQ